MKRNKVIKVNETTSVEVPMENLTLDQMIQLQCKMIRMQAEASLREAQVRHAQAVQMSRMIDLLEAQFEIRYPQFGIQRLLKNQKSPNRFN